MKVNWKSIRELYKRIKEQLYNDDNANRRMYVVGRDIFEIEETLICILQDRNGILKAKNSENSAQ